MAVASVKAEAAMAAFKEAALVKKVDAELAAGVALKAGGEGPTRAPTPTADPPVDLSNDDEKTDPGTSQLHANIADAIGVAIDLNPRALMGPGRVAKARHVAKGEALVDSAIGKLEPGTAKAEFVRELADKLYAVACINEAAKSLDVVTTRLNELVSQGVRGAPLLLEIVTALEQCGAAVDACDADALDSKIENIIDEFISNADVDASKGIAEFVRPLIACSGISMFPSKFEQIAKKLQHAISVGMGLAREAVLQLRAGDAQAATSYARVIAAGTHLKDYHNKLLVLRAAVGGDGQKVVKLIKERASASYSAKALIKSVIALRVENPSLLNDQSVFLGMLSQFTGDTVEKLTAVQGKKKKRKFKKGKAGQQ